MMSFSFSRRDDLIYWSNETSRLSLTRSSRSCTSFLTNRWISLHFLHFILLGFEGMEVELGKRRIQGSKECSGFQVLALVPFGRMT